MYMYCIHANLEGQTILFALDAFECGLRNGILRSLYSLRFKGLAGLDSTDSVGSERTILVVTGSSCAALDSLRRTLWLAWLVLS